MALFQSPMATGLFHRGIALSPGFQSPALFAQPAALAASTAGRNCMQAMQCVDADCLRAQPSSAFSVCTNYTTPGDFVGQPGLVFAGYDGDVLTGPIDAVACGDREVSNGHLPMIIGGVPHEWRLFSSFGFSGVGFIRTFLSEKLRGYSVASPDLQECALEELLRNYEDAQDGTCPRCAKFSGKADRLQLLSDIAFSRGVQLMASTGGGKRYRYILDVEAANASLGATHGSDLCYLNPRGLPNQRCGGTEGKKGHEAMLQTAQILTDYWTSFARTGAPWSQRGPVWEPVEPDPELQGMPMLHIRHRSRGNMTSEHVSGAAAARTMARLACGRAELRLGGKGAVDEGCTIVDVS